MFSSETGPIECMHVCVCVYECMCVYFLKKLIQAIVEADTKSAGQPGRLETQGGVKVAA